MQLKNVDGLTPIQLAKNCNQNEVEQYLFEATRQRSSSSPSLLQKELLPTREVEKSPDAEKQEMSPLNVKPEELPMDEKSKKIPPVEEPEDNPTGSVKATESVEPMEKPPGNLQPLVNPSRENGHLRQRLLSRNYLFLSIAFAILFVTISGDWIGRLGELIVQTWPSVRGLGRQGAIRHDCRNRIDCGGDESLRR